MNHVDIEIHSFLIIVLSVLVGYGGGVVAAVITRYLDYIMQPGHIFEFIRARRAANVAAKYKNRKEFVEYYRNTMKSDDLNVTEKIDEIERIYWEIASVDKRMLGLMCVICLGSRVWFVVAVLVAFWMASMCFTTLDIAIATIVSLAASFNHLYKSN